MFKWCARAYPTRSPRAREEKTRAASTNHTPRERDVGVLGKCLHALNLHTRQHRSPQSKSKNSRMQQTKESMSYTDGKWSVMGGLVVLIPELGKHPFLK